MNDEQDKQPEAARQIYAVDGWNNFCRVFRLPESFPDGYCFEGSRKTTFAMVDWFNPVPEVAITAVSKQVWEQEVGRIVAHKVDHAELSARLTEFIKRKTYFKQGSRFVVICDFGLCCLID